MAYSWKWYKNVYFFYSVPFLYLLIKVFGKNTIVGLKHHTRKRETNKKFKMRTTSVIDIDDDFFFIVRSFLIKYQGNCQMFDKSQLLLTPTK